MTVAGVSTVTAWGLALTPVGLAAFLAVLGYVLKQVVALAKEQARAASIIGAHGDRLDRLEAWQDGFRLGKASNGH